jgi:hypothetical protein
MNDTQRKYMDQAQAKEPRAVIVAESMQVFRGWCIDHDLDPTQVRLGRHPDYLYAFIGESEISGRTRGMQRGLKWIEVGALSYDLKDYLSSTRLADWQ